MVLKRELQLQQLAKPKKNLSGIVVVVVVVIVFVVVVFVGILVSVGTVVSVLVGVIVCHVFISVGFCCRFGPMRFID